jgi:hypothetical protein
MQNRGARGTIIIIHISRPEMQNIQTIKIPEAQPCAFFSSKMLRNVHRAGIVFFNSCKKHKINIYLFSLPKKQVIFLRWLFCL